MTRRFTLLAIVLALCAIGAAYLSAFSPGGAPEWAAWVMALAIAVLMIATMALGAARRGRLERLRLPLAATFLILAAGFGTALYLPRLDAATPPTLWLGLPPGAAIILYGVGVLPLLVAPIAYALTFDESTLSAADLEALRAAASALRAGTEADVAEQSAAPAIPPVTTAEPT